MIKKISNSDKLGQGPIKILYPGLKTGGRDSGLGTIGRIDQADIKPGITVKMHPHSNDDILSYFTIGKVQHIDSDGCQDTISGKRLMLMKSGRVFFHEETIEEHLEGLQIFIRPKTKDEPSEVVFFDVPEPKDNQWRLLASPTTATPFQFSSQTWISDILLTDESHIDVPPAPVKKLTGLLYVFQGHIMLNDFTSLSKGECAIFKEETLKFKSGSNAQVVLFYTDENSEYYTNGMYSGNQFNS